LIKGVEPLVKVAFLGARQSGSTEAEPVPEHMS
jgi:hypothetical protein